MDATDGLQPHMPSTDLKHMQTHMQRHRLFIQDRGELCNWRCTYSLKLTCLLATKRVAKRIPAPRPGGQCA